MTDETELRPCTFNGFLLDSEEQGITEFRLVAVKGENGRQDFYIHPLGKDGATGDFTVSGNVVLPMPGNWAAGSMVPFSDMCELIDTLKDERKNLETRAPDPVADTSKSCRTNTSNNGMTDFHPGEILLCDFVIPDLAMNLGLTDEQEDELYDIFDGVAPVSETMALIFSQVFDTTPELWMNLQRAYDEKTTERRQSEKTPNGNNRTETDGKTDNVTEREQTFERGSGCVFNDIDACVAADYVDLKQQAEDLKSVLLMFYRSLYLQDLAGSVEGLAVERALRKAGMTDTDFVAELNFDGEDE